MGDDEISGRLEGDTLEDEWTENPDPPPDYGKPDPRTIIEEIGRITWVWHTRNIDAEMQYAGPAVEVTQ